MSEKGEKYLKEMYTKNNLVIPNYKPRPSICKCCNQLNDIITEYLVINKPKPDTRYLLICSECEEKYTGQNALDIYNKFDNATK